MNIWATGDCHGKFNKFSKKSRMKLGISDGDIVVVSGDFGLLWSKDKEFEYNLKFFEGLPITVLWVQGNHENYDMIKEYKLEEWNGGLVRHIVKDKLILLERGQIFNIQGNIFFTFGGAESHDIEDGILDRSSENFKKQLKLLKLNKKKQYRILGESWWKEELPSEEELKTGLENLQAVSNKVDYIITHCAPDEVYGSDTNILTEYFNKLNREVDFKHWYFGHYHDDKKISDKHIGL